MAEDNGEITFDISLLEGEEVTEEHIKQSLTKAATDHEFVTKVKNHVAHHGKTHVVGVKQQGHP
jgi:hypothetical protein